MFHAKIKPDVLKQVVGAVSILVDEGKFHLSPTGIALRTVDPAHVAMVDLSLTSRGFEEYEAEERDLGVDLGKISGLLRLGGPDTVIEAHHDQGSNRLVINIGNIERRMSLIDTSSMAEPRIPSVELPAKVVLAGDEMDQGIKAAEAVSDRVTLTVDSKGFEMVAEGGTDVVTLQLPKDLLTDHQCTDKVRSLFSLPYFANMIRQARQGQVTMHLGTDCPAKIEFDIAGNEGHITYMLAPRIESE
jgi:proliferating cell nuclear antigen